VAAATVAAAFPLAAGAHVGGGALILLLPTHLYVAGGALVVVASFVLVALVPARLFARLESTGIRVEVGRLPGHGALSTTASLLSLGVAIGLLLAGVLGSRDPLRNPLPLFVWTVWWVGLTYLHAALGNLWAVLNPWMVDIQQALRAASDPFALGWNLLGTRDLHVVTSFLSEPSRVYAIWHTQVAVIVAAHVGSVTIAHALALRLAGRAAATALSQLPMLALMIGYTMFGLWLLSAPTTG